jgi:ribosomal protein S14
LQKINLLEISWQFVRIIHQLHAAQDCCRSQRGASQKRDGGLQAYPLTGKLMSKSENRCADCGSKLGLVSHHHWGLRFCRKACKDNFLAKSAQDHARMRKWFGFFARATT